MNKQERATFEIYVKLTAICALLGMEGKKKEQDKSTDTEPIISMQAFRFSSYHILSLYSTLLPKHQPTSHGKCPTVKQKMKRTTIFRSCFQIFSKHLQKKSQ